MRKVLLILLSLIMASQAMAGPAIRCESVLMAQPALSKIQEFRIRRHEKGLERALKRGDQYLEKWVQEQFILTYGKRLPLRDYIQLSKDERAQKLLYRMMQEKIVVEGFDSYAKMMELQNSNSDKVNFAIRKSLNIFWKLLSFPAFDLRDTKVTSDMLVSWMREGTGKHQKAIDKYLYERSAFRPKGQSELERYNHLKSTWVKIALLAWVYLTIVNWDDDQKEIQEANEEAEKQRALKVVNEFESKISAIGSGVDDMLKEYLHKDFLVQYNGFLKKYNEMPTDEEIQEMVVLSYRFYGIKISKDEVNNVKIP